MTETQKKEIYTYTSPWLIYAMNWSVRNDHKFRLAFGSFFEDYTNKVEVVQLNEETGNFSSKGIFDHPYPPTKLMWIPDKLSKYADLIGTAGDYMRLWEVTENGIQMRSLLNNVLFFFLLF